MIDNKKYEYVSKYITEELKKNQPFFSKSNYENFKSRILKIKERIEESRKEGRLLKIGIVGEVKAGKSSFLNALLFDGEDILPKASTPMTAALTKIVYSEDNEAKIVYYSQKDWESIEEYSKEYDKVVEKEYEKYKDEIEEFNLKQKNNIEFIPKEKKSKEEYKKEYKNEFEKEMPEKYKACKELTELARNKKDKGIMEKLGKTEIVKSENLKKELEKYIGADGDYTSIVKYVELKMNQEVLKEFEIIDTPGMNDPIISRGEKTKDFLGNCDVVFLLSYCGQFLTQEDISFMSETLPCEGVKEVIIIGSKFDSGVLDCNRTQNLKDAILISKNTYDKQASDNIDKSILSSPNSEILEKIKKSLPPVYTSALLFGCAVKIKKNEKYLKDEKHIMSRFDKQFKGMDLNDYKILLDLSGFIPINKKLKTIRENKNKIINEKNKKIESIEKSHLLSLLEDINIEANLNKSDLRKYDKNDLETQLENITNTLNSTRINIKNIFELTSVDALKVLKNIEINLQKESTNTKYTYIDVKSKQDTKSCVINVGFLGLKKDHYEKMEISYEANISNAKNNLRKYIVKCNEFINEELKKIVNTENLKRKIKNEIIKLFDLSSKDFDENKILIPVDIVIGKLQIPNIDINEEEFKNDSLSKINGVEGNEISKVEMKQVEVLSDIFNKVKEEIEKCRKKIETTLISYSSNFVDNLEEEIADNIKKLQNQLNDKEENIKKYNLFIENLKKFKKIINEMEI